MSGHVPIVDVVVIVMGRGLRTAYKETCDAELAARNKEKSMFGGLFSKVVAPRSSLSFFFLPFFLCPCLVFSRDVTPSPCAPLTVAVSRCRCTTIGRALSFPALDRAPVCSSTCLLAATLSVASCSNCTRTSCPRPQRTSGHCAQVRQGAARTSAACRTRTACVVTMSSRGHLWTLVAARGMDRRTQREEGPSAKLQGLHVSPRYSGLHVPGWREGERRRVREVSTRDPLMVWCVVTSGWRLHEGRRHWRCEHLR